MNGFSHKVAAAAALQCFGNLHSSALSAVQYKKYLQITWRHLMHSELLPASITAARLRRRHHGPDHNLARRLVLSYGWNAMAYQILNPGFRLWFSPEHDAVVGYSVSAGYRIVAGVPVCAPERLAAVAAAFAADARHQRQRVCYFGAQDRAADLLGADRSLARMLLGAQPVWHPAAWPELLAQKSSLRAQVARARNKGVQVNRWGTERATRHPALVACRNQWLQTRGLPPLHFLVESDTLGQLHDRRVFVAEQADRVVGFLVASPIPLRNGWLIEQTIRGPRAPNGVIELLIDAAMRDLAAAGTEYITLGLSPLSRRSGISPLPQPWSVQIALAAVRVLGRHFYNFDGLDAFKAKLNPQCWEPIYALTPEPRISLHTLYAVAGAFSGASPLQLAAHTLVRTAVHDTQSLLRKRK